MSITSEHLNEYWNLRASNEVRYKGEYFYTVTALPLYFQRRKVLLSEFKKILSNESKHISVLDFGCGDGYYAIWMKKNFPDANIKACDLSSAMINSAKEKASGLNIDFKTADSTIPFDQQFDLIITVAVLAHIMDNNILNKIADNLTHHLKPGGKLIIFEMTADIPRKGNTWNRRSESDYLKIFKDINLESKKLVAYPFFQKADVYLRKTFSLMARIGLCKKYTNLNQSKLYLTIAKLMMKISYLIKLKPKEGNTLFVFRKNSTTSISNNPN